MDTLKENKTNIKGYRYPESDIVATNLFMLFGPILGVDGYEDYFERHVINELSKINGSGNVIKDLAIIYTKNPAFDRNEDQKQYISWVHINAMEIYQNYQNSVAFFYFPKPTKYEEIELTRGYCRDTSQELIEAFYAHKQLGAQFVVIIENGSTQDETYIKTKGHLITGQNIPVYRSLHHGVEVAIKMLLPRNHR